MEEKQSTTKRRFQQPKLTRYGRLARITMQSVLRSGQLGGHGTVSGGKAGDFFGS
jgi:hypothetical protein